MLNALFGNPNIHLIHLHPDCKVGLKDSYDKSKQNFVGNFVDENTLQIGKKRRNAVTEVIRFVCSKMFNNPPKDGSDDDSTYSNALQSLLNGDVKSAL